MKRVSPKLAAITGVLLAAGLLWQAVLVQPGFEGRTDPTGVRTFLGATGPVVGGLLLVYAARLSQRRAHLVGAIAATVVMTLAAWLTLAWFNWN